jgi:hypothetical protein
LTGAALGGATVTMTGTQSFIATTDAAGRARFENLPGGDYVVAVTRPGFRGASQRLTLKSHMRGNLRLHPVATPEAPTVTPAEERRPAVVTGSEVSATLGAGLPESYGERMAPVPVGVFTAPGPGILHVTFTYRGAPRPELQYANSYGQGYRTEAVLRWLDGVVIGDRLAAGELRGQSETTKTRPITVRAAGDIVFTAEGEWTIARQIDGRWVDGPGGDRRHYLPGSVSVALRFVPAKD